MGLVGADGKPINSGRGDVPVTVPIDQAINIPNLNLNGAVAMLNKTIHYLTIKIFEGSKDREEMVNEFKLLFIDTPDDEIEKLVDNCINEFDPDNERGFKVEKEDKKDDDSDKEDSKIIQMKK